MPWILRALRSRREWGLALLLVLPLGVTETLGWEVQQEQLALVQQEQQRGLVLALELEPVLALALQQPW
jgi:hypothetical protein